MFEDQTANLAREQRYELVNDYNEDEINDTVHAGNEREIVNVLRTRDDERYSRGGTASSKR